MEIYAKSPISSDAPGFSSSLAPMRRRLQRFTPRAKVFGVKRNSNDSALSLNDLPSAYATRGMNMMGTSAMGSNPFAGTEPNLPIPPDLSDSKWLNYTERTALMTQSEEAILSEDVPKPMRKRPPPIKLSRKGRPSLDSTSSESPPNSASTISTMRRQAKTPVFRIGELEAKSYGREPRIAIKTSSVELIAEQYQAFLEHRDAMDEDEDEDEDDTASSVYTAYQSEPPLGERRDSVEENVDTARRYSAEDSPAKIILEPIRPNQSLREVSPTSSDGTYVGRDDDVIYFKPVSLSPCPPTPAQEDYLGAAGASIGQSPGSLSLQICVDLLSRELSSAFSDGSDRGSSDTSALQVWVMIEAYERLQSQVMEMDLPDADRENMEAMLSGWLYSLHKVHDKMSSRPSSGEQRS